MSYLKKIFGNISNLVIAILIILLLINTCGKNPTKSHVKTITKTTIKWDTIKDSIPTYIPKYYKKIITIKETDTFWRNVDTSFILKDYFASYIYKDSSINDSIKIYINDTITQNKIKSRNVNYLIKYHTITTTITNNIYLNNREFYVGGELGFTTTNLNHILAGILFKTKKSTIYNLGVGLTNDFQPLIKGGFYKKIGKK